MTTYSRRPSLGMASKQGKKRSHNCDAAAAASYLGESGTMAVSVVDGTGSSKVLSTIVGICAEVAVRVGARKGALAGVMAAAELVEDPAAEFPHLDAVMILAVTRPGQPDVIAHVGDCRAFTFSDDKLTQVTVDHTKGERMRQQGAPDAKAACFDNVPITSLARATVGTVALDETFDKVLILTSDGVHDALTPEEFAEIVRAHQDHPDACAKALVEAAAAGEKGDDATAAVIVHGAPIPCDGAELRVGR